MSMRCHGRRLRSLPAVAGGAWTVAAALAVAAGLDADTRDGANRAEVVAWCILPRVTLVEATADEPAVMLGGISDLWLDRAGTAAGRLRAWLVTDRGPNGTVTVDGREHRTLVSPSFTPRILELAIDWDPHAPGNFAARLATTTALVDRDGEPLSGRPNGLTNDPHMLDPSGRVAIAIDPDGVDTEGLVRTPAGGFWLAEEYRPSLLAADADGTARRRFVPRGTALAGAGMDVVDILPEVYANRRDNRGFEALALAPDQSRLFALLQSPAERPDRASSEQAGNVRLLAFDSRAGRPAAEHLYRLGDPTAEGYRTGRATPKDGKLCAMASVGPSSLVVLEQADGGLARLYLAELSGSTDTLPRTTAGDEPPLESLQDLDGTDVEPVEKTLLADLRPMLDAIRTQAGLVGDRAGPLKIEGLAVIDPWHVLLVNDDDFGVRKDITLPPPETCLWVVKLPVALPLTRF
jgi:hypothetical protein